MYFLLSNFRVGLVRRAPHGLYPSRNKALTGEIISSKLKIKGLGVRWSRNEGRCKGKPNFRKL